MTTLTHYIPTRLEPALDSLLRQIIFSRLERIRGGRIVLEEPHGRYEFGAQPGDRDGAPLSATIVVRDPRRMYRAIALGRDTGAAESYLAGDWECDDLVSLFRIFTRNMDLTNSLGGASAWLTRLRLRVRHWQRKNTRSGSRRNIYEHYDLGNEFFSLFLDDTMTYSAGIFESPEATMREASIAKLDRICRKLDLGPSDRVLEIGTGWGSFAIHAASTYGCHVTTTTISREQHALATERVRAAGLGDRVRVLCQDYRDLTGTYDKLVSIEMIEAVGHEFYDRFFQTCSERLATDGMMLLQAITMTDQRYDEARRDVDFIREYIFPGSVIPSATVLLSSVTRASDMRLFHYEDITPHYARTLAAWRARFHENHQAIGQLGYDQEFMRLWDYYLAYCEAGFTERYIGDVHMLLVKPGCRRAPILPPLTYS